jgi:hypothetical protein
MRASTKQTLKQWGVALAAASLVTLIGSQARGDTVTSRSGKSVRVAPEARQALQCVVDYVEAAGVRITAMRGFGAGTVKGSQHPGGRAIDINQHRRDVTYPKVPRKVSNAAADHCKVISGARWSYADNGHWNLPGRTAEPWPRTLSARAH